MGLMAFSGVLVIFGLFSGAQLLVILSVLGRLTSPSITESGRDVGEGTTPARFS